MIAGTLLAQMGVRSTVLDKARGPPTHPAAHLINNRTMELFRSIWLPNKRSGTAPSASHSNTQAHARRGADSNPTRLHGSGTRQDAVALMNKGTDRLRSLADVVQEAAPPFEHWRHFRYVDQLVGGTTYGVVDHFPGALDSGCV